MKINYPKGIPSFRETTSQEKKIRKRIHTAANRGMDFEKAINTTNEYYLEKDLALITKRPTPINVVKVDYEHDCKIVSAYFEKQSTTDYNGVYKGHYLDFEAKTTNSKTSLPINNIPIQQIEHLKSVNKHGGIAFFLVYWRTLHEVYLIKANDMIEYFENHARKSMPYSEMKRIGHQVKESLRPRFDYLALVETFLLEGEQ